MDLNANLIEPVRLFYDLNCCEKLLFGKPSEERSTFFQTLFAYFFKNSEHLFFVKARTFETKDVHEVIF